MIGTYSWPPGRASSKKRSCPRTATLVRVASSRSRWDEADKLIGVQITDGHREILLGTRQGIVIRFKEEDAPTNGPHRAWCTRHYIGRGQPGDRDGDYYAGLRHRRVNHHRKWVR